MGTSKRASARARTELAAHSARRSVQLTAQEAKRPGNVDPVRSYDQNYAASWTDRPVVIVAVVALRKFINVLASLAATNRSHHVTPDFRPVPSIIWSLDQNGDP